VSGRGGDPRHVEQRRVCTLAATAGVIAGLGVVGVIVVRFKVSQVTRLSIWEPSDRLTWALVKACLALVGTSLASTLFLAVAAYRLARRVEHRRNEP
jgi:hypothetical protein